MPTPFLRVGIVCAAVVASVLADAAPGRAQQGKTSFKFAFGPGKVAPGYTQVSPTATYSGQRGYGFEPGAKVVAVDRGGPDPVSGDFCTAERPFFFSVALPEGNYRVTVTLGDRAGESDTTVKAELRRLMLERVRTARGQFATRTFAVNVRRPALPGGGQVRLKDRERTTEAWAWDDKLTLEFNGKRPCLCALEITRADDAITVYLLGDSTVCDQPHEPYSSWGQMLPRFFKPAVAVANHAESGESVRGALAARRVDKVLSTLKAGDYLLLQFGHNDMRSVNAATYQAALRRVVAETRKKGGLPVLVTPVQRRRFQGKTVVNSHREFPDAVRSLAKEEGVPLIDLHALSKAFYEALGPERSAAAFKRGDATHHNGYGAYELARCVVEGLRQNRLALVRHLADDVKPFDPSHPDAPESFAVPSSPQGTKATPEGR